MAIFENNGIGEDNWMFAEYPDTAIGFQREACSICRASLIRIGLAEQTQKPLACFLAERFLKYNYIVIAVSEQFSNNSSSRRFLFRRNYAWQHVNVPGKNFDFGHRCIYLPRLTQATPENENTKNECGYFHNSTQKWKSSIIPSSQ